MFCRLVVLIYFDFLRYAFLLLLGSEKLAWHGILLTTQLAPLEYPYTLREQVVCLGVTIDLYWLCH